MSLLTTLLVPTAALAGAGAGFWFARRPRRGKEEADPTVPGTEESDDPLRVSL